MFIIIARHANGAITNTSVHDNRPAADRQALGLLAAKDGRTVIIYEVASAWQIAPKVDFTVTPVYPYTDGR